MNIIYFPEDDRRASLYLSKSRTTCRRRASIPSCNITPAVVPVCQHHPILSLSTSLFLYDSAIKPCASDEPYFLFIFPSWCDAGSEKSETVNFDMNKMGRGREIKRTAHVKLEEECAPEKR